VAEHRLHVPDVSPAFEHQRRHGVAEEVAGTALADAGRVDVLPQPVNVHRGTYNWSVEIRFYIDPANGEPHIYNHGVTEVEVEQVFSSGLGEDRVSREGSRMLLGQTDAGRFLRIIYAPDPMLNSVFVITAYELQGKPLTGYKRRQRRRRR
jgi:hypothetical protein